MSILHITEYERMGEVPGGYRVSAGVEPAITTQAIPFTATAGQSANFNVRTKFVRIEVTGAANILFGANPTAVTDVHTKLAAAQTEYFACDAAAITAGLKVSAVQATTNT